MTEIAPRVSAARPLGFWTCWALTVGTMIGSGIFMLPAVLAPYGLVSFGGWIVSAIGSILVALVIARLAGRTTRAGGPYVFAHDAFGDLAGFLIAWGYWASYWIAIPAIAIAFVGYLTVFFPGLSGNAPAQATAALALIWSLTLFALRGMREAGFVQVLMTILKVIPLLAIIVLGMAAGQTVNLPAFKTTDASLLSSLAATALLTTWAFSGLEAGCVPAGNVRDPERTIPRAVVAGTVFVTCVYLAATAAVMLLVPASMLATSTAPFADAARAFGAWGPGLIAAGALAATAGALNGAIIVAGQMPMAVALDGLAPATLARLNAGGSPQVSLLVSAVLGSLLLLANYARGLMGAFTFLLMMASITALAPLLFSAAADLRYSWRSARGWAGVAAIAGLYCIFAILGSGVEVIGWGLVLLVIGVPFYYVGRTKGRTPATGPA